MTMTVIEDNPDSCRADKKLDTVDATVERNVTKAHEEFSSPLSKGLVTDRMDSACSSSLTQLEKYNRYIELLSNQNDVEVGLSADDSYLVKVRKACEDFHHMLDEQWTGFKYFVGPKPSKSLTKNGPVGEKVLFSTNNTPQICPVAPENGVQVLNSHEPLVYSVVPDCDENVNIFHSRTSSAPQNSSGCVGCLKPPKAPKSKKKTFIDYILSARLGKKSKLMGLASGTEGNESRTAYDEVDQCQRVGKTDKHSCNVLEYIISARRGKKRSKSKEIPPATHDEVDQCQRMDNDLTDHQVWEQNESLRIAKEYFCGDLRNNENCNSECIIYNLNPRFDASANETKIYGNYTNIRQQDDKSQIILNKSLEPKVTCEQLLSNMFGCSGENSQTLKIYTPEIVINPPLDLVDGKTTLGDEKSVVSEWNSNEKIFTFSDYYRNQLQKSCKDFEDSFETNWCNVNFGNDFCRNQPPWAMAQSYMEADNIAKKYMNISGISNKSFSRNVSLFESDAMKPLTAKSQTIWNLYTSSGDTSNSNSFAAFQNTATFLSDYDIDEPLDTTWEKNKRSSFDDSKFCSGNEVEGFDEVDGSDANIKLLPCHSHEFSQNLLHSTPKHVVKKKQTWYKDKSYAYTDQYRKQMKTLNELDFSDIKMSSHRKSLQEAYVSLYSDAQSTTPFSDNSIFVTRCEDSNESQHKESPLLNDISVVVDKRDLDSVHLDLDAVTKLSKDACAELCRSVMLLS